MKNKTKTVVENTIGILFLTFLILALAYFQLLSAMRELPLGAAIYLTVSFVFLYITITLGIDKMIRKIKDIAKEEEKEAEEVETLGGTEHE